MSMVDRKNTEKSRSLSDSQASMLSVAEGESVISIRNFSLWYGDFQALKHISLEIPKNKATAFIGPSGCGKSTLLRTFNRMCDFVPTVRTEGTIEVAGRDIFATEPNELRVMVGMVFQQPTPFRKSIRDNILFAPKRHGLVKGKDECDALVEEALRAGALWDEVKDKLDQSAHALSGGQQQRLCIARTLAMHPDVVLFDEPCSALDPISTFSVEETIREIAQTGICAIIVTHNMEQATRVSDRTAFFYVGDMVETGPTKQIFSAPKDQRLQDYLTGRFG